MTEWRKSSYTTGSGGTTECVEVAEFSVGGAPDEVGQSSALVSERIEGRRISTI
ncbi:DUF397 domain-containing protein [Actinoallomurus sp. CA-150999]|uniref:DUF397 domain-containing protein n=1 Tax=Actinoallomurus sp. CA-150999 TaxID=3239887 RepID=UPI003D8AEC7A